MDSVKTDRRVRKTRDRLRQILIEMLHKRDLKDISVLELTAQADVNRGTFYLHYKDIYDLFEQIENDIIQDFVNLITAQDLTATGIREHLLMSAFRFLEANVTVIDVILRVDETKFLDRMLTVIRPQSDTEWRKFFPVGNPQFFEYYYTFITSACIGLFRQWFDQGRHESPDFMARLSMKLVSSCVNGLE
jgi:AcrR family transcriptional regulator